MSLTDFAMLALELQKRKEEFEIKRDKDKYIKYLQEKNDELIKEYTGLYSDMESLKSELEKNESSELNDIHLDILEFIIDIDRDIRDSVIKEFINKRSEYQIGFSELIDLEYIKKYQRVIVRNHPQEDKYHLNNKRKTEILKLLHRRNN